jgi:hypothetical protein
MNPPQADSLGRTAGLGASAWAGAPTCALAAGTAEAQNKSATANFRHAEKVLLLGTGISLSVRDIKGFRRWGCFQYAQVRVFFGEGLNSRRRRPEGFGTAGNFILLSAEPGRQHLCSTPAAACLRV